MAASGAFPSWFLLWLLQLVAVSTCLDASASRVHVHRFTPEAEFKGENFPGRQLITEDAAGFRASLQRRTAANLTRAERFYHAVQKSKARAKALAAGLGVSSSKAVSAEAFESPVASINGAYTMELRLGTPPQKFSAIADTGSDLVWVQCKPCTSCYSQNDPLFNPSASSTFSKQSCTTSYCKGLSASACSKSGGTCIYGYQYGDSSSTQGDLAIETVTLVSSNGKSQGFSGFQFGCGRQNSGSFGGAAGIVGLGQGSLSLATQLPPSIGSKFSYCLVDFDDVTSTSPLLFGSSAAISGSSQSTPIIPNPSRSTYYYVGLEGVSVGGKSLSLSTRVVHYTKVSPKTGKKVRARTLEVNAGGTIFDSGTTLTLLDDPVYNEIISAFKSLINLPTVDGSSAGFDLCYRVKNGKYKFPSLKLKFTGTEFVPPQDNYFVMVDTAGTVACLAMASSSGLGLGIIGNLMQQNHQVLYDHGAGVISFAPAKCSSL